MVLVTTNKLALGLDFGTESVRALLVDLNGIEIASAVSKYARGQVLNALPDGEPLPALFALQDPNDWISSAASAVQEAMRSANVQPESVIGVGVDFTSCTMLPTTADGTPLCNVADFRREPHAWPKLWKHHGAQQQADRLTAVAKERNEDFLKRYGGVIGLEWFFPKVLEVLEQAPGVYDATEIWLEAGDWFVWQLVSGAAGELPRSTCQAGYKAMWSAEDGYPSTDYLNAVHPRLAETVVNKLPGKLVAPGQAAGGLCAGMADRLGLHVGTPVSAAIIDAHAGVPGVGAASAGTLVMVMGTSSCHMLNAPNASMVSGVAGIVKDGILPGYYGYETGQAAVGDAFDWLRSLLGHKDHSELAEQAANIPPGADGVTCVDWMNGCRTPLMDGELSGGFSGLKMHHRPAHLYRALLEASAFGVRWIVDCLEESGISVKSLVATGGLPHHNPALVQIYADVLGRPILVHPSKQGPALGAAILGAIAAGEERSGFSTTEQAVETMAAPRDDDPARRAEIVEPAVEHSNDYQAAYAKYRQLADHLSSRRNTYA